MLSSSAEGLSGETACTRQVGLEVSLSLTWDIKLKMLCIGKITLGDILEILPFDDPVVCLEVSPVAGLCSSYDSHHFGQKLDGKGVHDVLECALSKWPAQEG